MTLVIFGETLWIYLMELAQHQRRGGWEGGGVVAHNLHKSLDLSRPRLMHTPHLAPIMKQTYHFERITASLDLG